MMRLLVTAATFVIALAACDNPTLPAELPPEASAPPADETISSSPIETAEAAAPRAPPMGPYAATPAPGEQLPTSQTTPGPIPLAFRHVWAIDPADCRADPGPTRIAIAPGAIRAYGGRFVVVKSQLEGEDKVLLDVEHMSEGRSTLRRHALTLDRTKTRLIYVRGEDSATYIRCD